MPLLKVDSTQRTFGTPEEYDIDLLVSTKDTLRARLVAANVPKSIYPVVDGYNSQFDANLGGGSATFNIANLTDYRSIITPADLAAAMTTELSASVAGNTVAYDATQNRLAWTSAAGGNMSGSTSAAFNRMAGLTTTALVVTGGNTVYLPNMVDMSWPRWLRLTITLGSSGDRVSTVIDSDKSTSFHFHFNQAEFAEIESMQEGETFMQKDFVSDTNIQRMHVKWEYPDADAGTLSFNGIEHQFVLDVF